MWSLVLFSSKCAVLSVLVATPSWTPSTARIFYENRGLWVLIMAQLTLGMYSGETAMAWVARVVATFWQVYVACFKAKSSFADLM